MFGRFVKFEGRSIFVCCTPKTPWSEILRRAAEIMAREEKEAEQNDPNIVAYRAAILQLSRSEHS